MKKNIQATEPNILKLFINKDGKYQFWRETNMPEIIRGEKFYMSKAGYIEDNPVRKRYVRKAEDWVYSSANRDRCLLELESIYT